MASDTNSININDIIRELHEHGVGSTVINNLVTYIAKTRWDAAKEAALDGEWPVSKPGFADELGKHKDRLCGLSAAIVGMRHAIGKDDIHVDGVQRLALDIELNSLRLIHVYSALFDRAQPRAD